MFRNSDTRLLLNMFKDEPDYIEIREGETLFRKGESGDVMYVLLEGAASVTIDGVLFEELSKGACVGEMSLIDDSPRFGTVTARTDCKFAVLKKEHFLFLIEKMPGFALEVMRILVQRLKRCDMRVVHAASHH